MAAQVFADSSKEYAPTPNHYPAIQQLTQGHVSEPGTVDLTRRQVIDHDPVNKIPDPRSYGSEYSARDKLPDGRWMSYPMIYNGAAHPRKEAFEYAQKNNQHTGIYNKDTPDKVMDQADTMLHARPQTVEGKPLNGDVWAAMKRTQSMFRQRNKWAIDTRDHVKEEAR